jgi:neutral ceramidase
MNMSYRWGAALVMLSLAIAVPGVAEGGWRAGVATADITPDGPLWLAGYAGRDRAAEGILHPLWVKALALEDAEGRRAVLVSSDLLGFPKSVSDRIRDRLHERLELERDQILLNSSHTHSGPVLLDSLNGMYPLDEAQLDLIKAYSAQLEDTIVDLVARAFDDLKPAQLSSGNGLSRYAVNRRNNNEAKILETHDFKGPVDHAVPVLLVSNEDGSPRAIVFGYACHATVLSGYEWCGDHPGFAQIAIEKAYPGAVALFAAGCGADQNPLPRRTVALARQYGEQLAAAVVRAIEDVMQPLAPRLDTHYTEVELALMPPPERDAFETIAREGAPYMAGCAREYLAQLDAGLPLRETYPYCLQLWRIGDQTIVAMGGEVVVDYALFLKNMLGNDTFVFGYSNDVMSYIPSKRVLNEGGYEGDTSQFIYGMPAKWRDDIEERILDSLRTLAHAAGLEAAAEP